MWTFLRGSECAVLLVFGADDEVTIIKWLFWGWTPCPVAIGAAGMAVALMPGVAGAWRAAPWTGTLSWLISAELPYISAQHPHIVHRLMGKHTVLHFHTMCDKGLGGKRYIYLIPVQIVSKSTSSIVLWLIPIYLLYAVLCSESNLSQKSKELNLKKP